MQINLPIMFHKCLIEHMSSEVSTLLLEINPVQLGPDDIVHYPAGITQHCWDT